MNATTFTGIFPPVVTPLNDDGSIDFESLDNVIEYLIAEGMHGIGREAQVPALLDLYRIPYTFSDPLVMSLALHKGMTKRVLRDAGVATADFVIAASAADAAAG